MKWMIFVFLILLTMKNALAQITIIPPYSENLYLKNIHIIFQKLGPSNNIQSKIEQLSEFFLGVPYLMNALGEGPSGEFDKRPLYRTDAFDCVTFVSTVLALAYSHNENEFLYHLKQIQYRDAQISFVNRFHFIELDWNKNIISKGYLREITQKITHDYQVVHAIINKPLWYLSFGPEMLKFFNPTDQRTECRLLKRLHQMGKSESIDVCDTYYVPLTLLFSKRQNNLIAQQQIFSKIPSGSVIEIVDKTCHHVVGSDSNVAHLGFVIINSQGLLLLRHASRCYQRVVDVPLTQYLARYYSLVKNPDRVGIAIFSLK